MKRTLTLGIVLVSAFATQAQLTITDSLSVGSIATLLQGLGVTVSNVQVNCAGAALGQFSGPSELAISQGLLLTSGSADAVAGPVSNFATGYNGGLGDADLEAAAGNGAISYDACGLEFDCVPQGDTLLFNFSFGSEEYQEFVGSAFNDAFAIYLTGPGFPFATNVAAIPGGTIVSINNVNEQVNSGYYHNNEASAGQYVAYDGFTTNLTAFAVVQPSETYHFKVVVADMSDFAFDSGVFLEAFSFRSPLNISTGIADASLSAVQVLAQGDAHVLRVPAGMSRGQQVVIFDATGSVVRRQALTGSNTVLATEGWSAGLYIVQVPGVAPVRFMKN
jgi:hypothetical protein